VKSYGTLEQPFPELPPAASLYSVQWGGAIKWPTAPFSYAEKTGAADPLLTDSYTGTASFWFRINGTMPALEGGVSAVVPVVYVAGPRIFDTADGRNVDDYGFYIWVYTNPGDVFGLVFQIQRQIGVMLSQFRMDTSELFTGPSSLPTGLCDDKWAHFLLSWDTDAATGTLTVNKTSRTLYSNSFSQDTSAEVDPIGYAGAYVPWTQTPRFFGARAFYSEVESGPSDVTIGPADSLTENHLISLAHVWVDTQTIVTDAAKFVTGDDRPKALGPAGEFLDGAGDVILGTAPDFYFSGGPNGFVQNRATGGEVTLVGDPPVSQSVAVKIGA